MEYTHLQIKSFLFLCVEISNDFLFQYSICQVFQDGGKDSVLWSMMFLVLGGIQFLANAVQVSFTLTLKASIVKLYINYKFKLVLVTLILSNWFNFYLFTR